MPIMELARFLHRTMIIILGSIWFRWYGSVFEVYSIFIDIILVIR